MISEPGRLRGPADSDILSRVLDPGQARELGGSLRRIRDDVVAQPRGGRTLAWYQGAGVFFDLFLEWAGGAEVHWLQMTRAGRFVECDFPSRSLVTGRTGDGEHRDVPRSHPHSRALSPDPTADVGLLDELISIVESRANEAPFDTLSNQLREQIGRAHV